MIKYGIIIYTSWITINFREFKNKKQFFCPKQEGKKFFLQQFCFLHFSRILFVLLSTFLCFLIHWKPKQFHVYSANLRNKRNCILNATTGGKYYVIIM